MQAELSRLEEQLWRALEGEAWHGPSVLEALEGVSAEQAAAHPIAGAHSIWELVLHLCGTYGLVLRRLGGEGRQLTEAEDWPAVPEPSAENWNDSIRVLKQLNEDLRQAVRNFPGERLDQPLVPEAPYTAYTQFIGVTQHNLYHVGQMALLKKALGSDGVLRSGQVGGAQSLGGTTRLWRIQMSNPAEGYESYMVPTLFGPWATKLIEAADPQPGERVLDVGCGTGIVARQVASWLGARGAVTGIDLSPDMLAVAQATAAREGAAIEWREGSAEHLPFPENTFDLVLCQFVLMFFADKAVALAEMRRVLTGSGRVLVSVWQGLDRHPFYQTLHNVIKQRLGMSALQDIFALGNGGKLRALAKGAGFQQVEIDPISMTARFPNPDGFLAREIEVDTAAIPSMQHLDAQARQAIVAAIRADMTSPLKDLTLDNHVVIEFHAHIVSASQ